jgi:putative N6-adenine-specific DNA methylase
MLLNPPYGERIEVAGVAARRKAQRRHAAPAKRPRPKMAASFSASSPATGKRTTPAGRAWVLTPDLKLPGSMRLKESRRVPMWNGPIECRMFRFDMVAGRVKAQGTSGPADGPPA